MRVREAVAVAVGLVVALTTGHAQKKERLNPVIALLEQNKPRATGGGA